MPLLSSPAHHLIVLDPHTSPHSPPTPLRLVFSRLLQRLSSHRAHLHPHTVLIVDAITSLPSPTPHLAVLFDPVSPRDPRILATAHARLRSITTSPPSLPLSHLSSYASALVRNATAWPSVPPTAMHVFAATPLCAALSHLSVAPDVYPHDQLPLAIQSVLATLLETPLSLHVKPTIAPLTLRARPRVLHTTRTITPLHHDVLALCTVPTSSIRTDVRGASMLIFPATPLATPPFAGLLQSLSASNLSLVCTWRNAVDLIVLSTSHCPVGRAPCAALLRETALGEMVLPVPRTVAIASDVADVGHVIVVAVEDLPSYMFDAEALDISSLQRNWELALRGDAPGSTMHPVLDGVDNSEDPMRTDVTINGTDGADFMNRAENVAVPASFVSARGLSAASGESLPIPQTGSRLRLRRKVLTARVGIATPLGGSSATGTGASVGNDRSIARPWWARGGTRRISFGVPPGSRK